MTLIGEAFVRIRPDTSGFRQETSRQVRRELTAAERQAQATTRQVDQLGRRFGALGAIAPGVGAAVAGTLGLIGVVAGKSISAALESQRVASQLTNVLEQQGFATDQNTQAIEHRTQALSQMSGFDDELATQTFINLFRVTNNVTKALNDNALAADIARGRNISLEAAAQLVIKAELEQVGALRRVGIAAKEGATSLELLNLLQTKFAGSAQAFGQTAQGAIERFKVALENTEETIGGAFLPRFTELLNRTTKFLNNQDNQKRIQDGVNEGLDKAARLAKVLGEGYQKTEHGVSTLARAYGKLSDAIRFLSGGVPDQVNGENAVTDALKRQAEALQVVIDGYAGIEEARRGASATLTGRAPPIRTGIVPAHVRGTGVGPGRAFTPEEQLAIALGADPDNPNLLRQERARLQKALNFALAQQNKPGRDAAFFAGEAARIAGEITGITQHLAAIQAAEAAKTKAAADAAAAAREKQRQAILDAIGAGVGVGGNVLAPGAFAAFQAASAAAIPGVVGGTATVDTSKARQALLDVPAVLRLQLQIAEARFENEDKLIPILEKTVTALERNLAKLKRLKATQEEQLQVVLGIAETKRRIRDINARDAQQSGFTLSQFFAEAAREQSLYGSNIGAVDTLSPQSGRGGFGSRLPLLGGHTIVQNFYAERDAAQAIQQASQAARALR